MAKKNLSCLYLKNLKMKKLYWETETIIKIRKFSNKKKVLGVPKRRNSEPEFSEIPAEFFLSF